MTHVEAATILIEAEARALVKALALEGKRADPVRALYSVKCEVDAAVAGLMAAAKAEPGAVEPRPWGDDA